MMTGALLKAWKNVRPHVPLIKFRKGGPFRENTAAGGAEAPKGTKAAPSGAPSKHVQRLPVIEDWELPPQYQRLKLDEKEINAINSGGAY